MTTKLKVVKIGGSVIAPKKESLSADVPTILRLAEELSRFMRENPSVMVALVHGGGSFGHFLVKECEKEDGFLGKECFSRVAFFMDELGRIVTEAML
ncbi:MAG: hypothetical protein J7L55_00090, partial [Desulfurococcales archaeon]|nr:hypothetical protein [Desulfurococcales archaeon]